MLDIFRSAFFSFYCHNKPRGKTPTSLITHRGRVTHICVGKQTNIGSDNRLSPGGRQSITWTNAGKLLFGPPETNFSEILQKHLCHLNTSSKPCSHICQHRQDGMSVLLLLHIANEALAPSAILGSNSLAFVIHCGTKDFPLMSVSKIWCHLFIY